MTRFSPIPKPSWSIASVIPMASSRPPPAAASLVCPKQVVPNILHLGKLPLRQLTAPVSPSLGRSLAHVSTVSYHRHSTAQTTKSSP